MYKCSVLLVSAIFCCAQCIPLNATHSESSLSSEVHLLVNNKNQSTNNQLTPVTSELENLDQYVDDQLKAILPYLSFFFDSLLGTNSAGGDDCVNDLVIEMVPDETALPPNSNEKSVEKKDNPVQNPDLAATPEKPVDYNN